MAVSFGSTAARLRLAVLAYGLEPAALRDDALDGLAPADGSLLAGDALRAPVVHGDGHGRDVLERAHLVRADEAGVLAVRVVLVYRDAVPVHGGEVGAAHVARDEDGLAGDSVADDVALGTFVWADAEVAVVVVAVVRKLRRGVCAWRE